MNNDMTKSAMITICGRPNVGKSTLANALVGEKIAIVSNKPDFMAKSVVERFYGKDYFFYVTGEREGIALKPDPRAVLSVVRAEGVSLDDCLYIGDTSTDMKTGKNAGIFTVGVLWGFRDKKELLISGADATVSHPSELLALL